MNNWDPNWGFVIIGVGVLIAFYVEAKINRSYRALDRKQAVFYKEERLAREAMISGRCAACGERIDNVFARMDEQEAKR